MATREEIVDEIAGFALFADLATPQLERVAHTFEEQVYAEGERVLRQGLSGSAFHVILDGDAAGRDRRQRAGDARRAATSSARSRSCSASRPVADVVATRTHALPRARWRTSSSRSCSRTRPSCTGCSRRRRAGCGTRTVGGADRPPVPAGFVPGRRRRERAGRPPGLVLPHEVRRAARRAVGRRRAGRHVPPLAVLPATAVVDEAVRPGRTRRTRPTSATTGTASWPTSRRTRRSCRTSWTATSYFPSRPEMQTNLETFAARTGIRVRYGCRWTGDAARTGARRHGRRSSWRRPTASTGRRRSSFAVGVAEPYRAGHAGHRARRPLRRRPPGRDLRRPSGLHHRQAELRVRAGVRAAAVGPPDRPRVAIAGEAVGQHALARRGPGALRPAGRGPRRWAAASSILDAAIQGRSGGSTAGRSRSSGPTDRRRRRARVRGRRGHRGDGFRGAAARPAGPRRHDVRPEPAAGPDAVLGERLGARHLLRRDDHPGCGRASRSTACRRTPGRSTAPATTRGSWPGTSRRPSSRRRLRWSGRRSPADGSSTALGRRADVGAGALAPAGLSRPRRLARPGRRAARRGRSCRSRRSSTRPATTARRRGRGDARGRRLRRDLSGRLCAAGRPARRGHVRPGPRCCATTRRRCAQRPRRRLGEAGVGWRCQPLTANRREVSH